MTKPKKKKAVSRKTLQNRMDKNWAIAVKELAHNECEKCGAGWKHKKYIDSKGQPAVRRLGLEAHHIVGRSYKATRWDLGNGLCLCTGCHVYRGAHSDCFIDQVGFHKWLWEYFKQNRESWFGSLVDMISRAEENGAKALPMDKIKEIDLALKLAVK